MHDIHLPSIVVLIVPAAQVLGLNPESYIGYELKYTALHGALRYDEAIETFKIMHSKLDDDPDAHMKSGIRNNHASVR
jgi:hypothetical protein